VIAPVSRSGVIAFAAALLFTPCVQFTCRQWKLYDVPGPLKIHSRPIPRLGGVAIALALFSGIILPRDFRAFPSWPIFASLTVVWVAGLIDDVRGLPPVARLIAQITAASIIWEGGWRMPFVANTVLNLTATCVLVVWFVNAFNFLDGIDGLAAGTAALLAVGYGLGSASRLGIAGGTLAWALTGACLGFLCFNFAPAKIFMGDSGSTLLGFSLAFLALDLYRAHSAGVASPVFPVLIAAIPLLDAGLAIVRRVLSGGSPFNGDRRHFYDLLVERGWQPRKIVLVCYALTAGLVGIGWLSLRMAIGSAILLTAACWGMLATCAIRLGALRSGQSVERVREAPAAATAADTLEIEGGPSLSRVRD